MCDSWLPHCVVENAVKGAFEQIADSAASAAGQIIVESFTWWLHTSSVDPQTPAVVTAQAYTVPLIALVLMGSVLVQAMRMTLSRKRDPALNVAVGLVRYFVVATLGLVVLSGALKAADDFSVWVVDQGMADFAVQIRRSLTADVVTNPFLLLVLGGLGVVLGVLQWVLGFVRQAGVLVLAALLPLAAAGSINESTKPWLNRMLPWLLTLVCYRPMAALIYSIGFTFLGRANDVTTAMTGLMVLVLAVIAMPAMMRFFSWAGVSMTGGGGAVMAGAIGAASLLGASSRAPATQHANDLAARGPGSNTPPATGAVPTGAPSTTPIGPHGGPGGSEGGRETSGAVGEQSTPGADAASRTAGGGSPTGGTAGAGTAGAGTAGAALAVGALAAQWTRQAAVGAAEGMTGGEGDQR
jgi:type IV secretion system protein TrbL